jgi:L-amino acid N-acyltransferase YncA
LADGLRVRLACLDDAAAIAEIYNQGIEDRAATFETELRGADERRQWLESLAGRYPVVVGDLAGLVVGWGAIGPYSPRAYYRGIGEGSIYVHRDWRRHGVGDVLLGELIGLAEQRGFWKLIGRIFPFNRASLALCRKHGFREVGTHERHAQLDGQWLDVVVVERLIPANQTGV